MAGRVNTKFVVLLSSVLIILVLGLVGFYFLVVRKGFDQLVAQGDEYVQSGEIELALKVYGKAFHKTPNDLPLIDKFIHALMIVEANDAVEARRYFGQYRELHRIAAELDPTDNERLDQLYSMVVNLAQKLSPAWYDWLYQLTQSKLERYPDNLIAMRYHGIAQVNRMSPDMPRSAQLEAYDHLKAVYKHDPQDTEVASHLARWKLIEAHRLWRQRATGAEVQELRDQALQVSTDSYEQDTADLNRCIRHVQIIAMLSEQLQNQFELLDEEAERELQMERHIEPLMEVAAMVMQTVEAKLLEDPQPENQVLAAAELLSRTDKKMVEESRSSVTSGQVRAKNLIERAVEAHPKDISYKVRLGRILEYMGEKDKALEVLRKAREAGTRGSALKALAASELQVTASLTSGELLVEQLAGTGTEEQKQEISGEIEEILEQVVAIIGEDSRVDALKGRLKLAQRRYPEATILLDSASTKQGDQNNELLLLSARARRQIKEWGAAAERYELLLERFPGLPWEIYLELAEIYINMGDFEKGKDLIDTTLKEKPRHPAALLMKATILSREKQTKEAIAILESMDANEYPPMAEPLVQLYLADEQKEKARELAQAQFDIDPSKNRRFLRYLLSLSEHEEQREKAIDQAKAAGIEDSVVTVIKSLVDRTEIDTDQLIEDQADPFNKLLLKHLKFRGEGDWDGAQAALDEAYEMKPEDPKVVDLQFRMGLATKNWDAANLWAAEARKMNLDLANGGFYFARLHHIKGEDGLALAEYATALKARPVYSAGWREFGNLLAANHQYDRALEAYQKAVNIKPNNVWAWRAMAQVEYQRGNHLEALEHIQEALVLSPNNEQLRMQYLYYEGQKGNKELALEQRQQLAQDQPKNTENRRALARLLGEMERFEEAMQVINELIESEDGRNGPNLHTVAALHAAAGDWDKGLEVLKQYVSDRADEANVEDLLLIARYIRSSNDPEQIWDAYNQAKSLEDPVQRPVTRELADVLFSMRENAKAIELYRELNASAPDDVVVRMRLAEALIRDDLLDDARQVAEELPRTSQSLVLKSQIARGRIDLVEARKLLDEAITIDPGNAVALFQRALILRNWDPPLFIEAVDDLRSALDLSKDLHAARLSLAEIYLVRGDDSEAMRELRTLVELRPAYRQARKMLIDLCLQEEALTEADQLLEGGEQLYSDEEVWPRMRAIVADKREDPNVAMDHWKRAVKLAQEDPAQQASNLVNLAVLHIRQRQPEDALDLLRDHADRVNQSALLQATRGWSLAMTGKRREGRAVFTRSIERSGSLPELNVIAEYAYSALGPKQAIELFLQVETPPEPAYWVELVVAKLHTHADQYKRALELLNQIQPQLIHDDVLARLELDRLLSVSLYQTYDYKGALEAYERVLGLEPSNLVTLNNIAYLLADELKDPAAALPYAERAAGLDSSNPQVLDTLGWVQYKVGQLEDASSTLEESVKIKPLPENCLHLGLVLLELGKTDRAGRYFEDAVALAERLNNPEVLEQATELLTGVVE